MGYDEGGEAAVASDIARRLGDLGRDRRRDRSSAAEVAAAALRDLIMEGELPPGTKVSEEVFMGPLEVSRNTLREAFRLLAHEKLLEHKLNRGVFVRSLATTDVADLFLVRRMIECAALGMAGAEDVSRLSVAVEHGEAAAEDGRWGDVGTANIRFHQAIAALSGSPRISELMGQVAAELRLAFHEMGDPRAFHEDYLRRNREIVDRLAEGDTSAAQDLLTAYLRASEQEMVAAFAAMGRGEIPASKAGA